MNHVIEHVFDSPFFYKQLELDSDTSLDRLKRERSKKRLDFQNGGGIQILTLNARQKNIVSKSAMGFGGNRIILDESSLIDDPLYSTVKRMLGGHRYKDTLLFEIGNPWERNHFWRTWHSNRYYKIFVNYEDALTEGRFDKEFINEMRDEAYFDILYECKFPNEEELDSRGYRHLIGMDLIQKAIIDEFKKEGELKLGVDIGAGGDYNVYCIRSPHMAFIESTNQSNDTMTNIGEIETSYNI